MVRNWQRLGWLTALVALLSALPSQAGAEENPLPPKLSPPEVPARQPDDLRKALADLEGELRRSLSQLERDQTLGLQSAQREVEDLKRQVAQMRQDLDELRKRLEQGQASTARYTPQPAPQAGVVRLVNAYEEPVAITVNGRAYRLGPGETRLAAPVPAGTFTYQVLGVQTQPQTRTLAPGERFTVTVHPRSDGL
jgi:septal ring factor EnvC (AmiA/AmiB activator)